MIYYNGIVVHYNIVLRYHRLLWKNSKNVLKGECRKEGAKYEGGGGDGTSLIPTTNFICL